MVRRWVAWTQATGGGEGGPGSDQGGTICLNMFQSCLATVSTVEAWASWSVATSLVAEGATTVLLLWHLLNSMPILSGVGRSGVCVGRAVNNSIMGQGMRVNLLSWQWGVGVDGKGSGQYESWEGGFWL